MQPLQLITSEQPEEKPRRNTIIFDRVLLWCQKYEEHLGVEFIVTDKIPYNQIKSLKDRPLTEIAERLDYMMKEDEYFQGDPQKCTIPAFVRNYNRFVKKKETIPDTHYECEYCHTQVRKTGRDGHRFACPKYPKELLY